MTMPPFTPVVEQDRRERERREELAECMWETDDDGISHTACGEAFALDSGTPAENRMRFCCYCGKPLVEPVRAPREEG